MVSARVVVCRQTKWDKKTISIGDIQSERELIVNGYDDGMRSAT